MTGSTSAAAVSPRAASGYALALSLLLSVSPWLLGGCSNDPEEPEVQIRQSIDSAQRAASNKNVSDLMEIVSKQYVDGRGLTHQHVARLVAFYLNRYQTVHLFTRIKEIDLTDAENAHVDLLVAMAGQPIGEESDLTNLRADLYRFNLRFVKENADSWRIVRTNWSRAHPADFL